MRKVLLTSAALAAFALGMSLSPVLACPEKAELTKPVAQAPAVTQDVSAKRKKKRRVVIRQYKAPTYYGYYGPTYYDQPYVRPRPLWGGPYAATPMGWGGWGGWW